MEVWQHACAACVITSANQNKTAAKSLGRDIQTAFYIEHFTTPDCKCRFH